MMTLFSFLFGISLAQADDETEDIRVFVQGMVCSFCVQGVEKQFKKQESIEKVEVDLEDSLVSIWLKEGKELSDDTIDKLIKDSGYNVESIERFSEEKEQTEKTEQTPQEEPKKTPVPETNTPKPEGEKHQSK